MHPVHLRDYLHIIGFKKSLKGNIPGAFFHGAFAKPKTVKSNIAVQYRLDGYFFLSKLQHFYHKIQRF